MLGRALISNSTKEYVIGVYPLLEGDLCHFLALDFDDDEWVDNSTVVLEICHQLKVPATLERSRSGNGGHLWIFFAEPIPAKKARQLGSMLLDKALQGRPQLGLESFDRMFPNQDNTPRGGFGNLIALPLQKEPRENHNTVFIDSKLEPYCRSHRHTRGNLWLSRKPLTLIP